MAEIRLHDSRTRRKVALAPLDPNNVRMYVCGPTVYDRAHLGNARPVVVFDTLYRLLRHEFGPDHVTYVRNFTDVDDKINAAAQARKAAGDERSLETLIAERTAETIGWYHADMDALGALRPSLRGVVSDAAEPRATNYIGPMVAMIQTLIEGGHAYEKAGHVLFRVRSYASYGALSGRSVDDMIAGARVEVAPFKEDPLDFVLWKPSDSGLPGWDSPWGRGRPGWHIECSAMSHELLGASFDIHGGGLDLQFPHHENEIAQSCCAHPGAGFASIWMHNEMLLVEGKKMSKSLGNFFTVRDLLDQGVPGEVIRFVFLSTHYSKPMDWTEAKRQEAEKRLDKLLPALKIAVAQGISPSEHWSNLPESVQIGLAGDMHTATAISGLEATAENLIRASNGELVSSAGDPVRTLSVHLVGTLNVLGLYELMLKRRARREGAREQLDDLHLRFVLEYERAKRTKNFFPVDSLKSSLEAAGVEVRISKEKIELLPNSTFDPAKLESLK